MRPRFQISAVGTLIVILIAALGFAAVSATGSEPEPTAALDGTLPESLSARVAAAGLAAIVSPEIEVATPTTAAPLAVEPLPSPSTDPEPEPTTTTTTSPPPATTTTSTTSAPTTTTTAPPATTTTTTTSPPATTTTAPPESTTTTIAGGTTTTTAPPVTGGPRDVEEWRALTAQHFPADLVDEALSVMRCESLGDPLAYNSSSGASGLFQFIPGTWAWAAPGAGYGGASPFEPEANVAAAAWLAQTSIDQGKSAWAHWSCKP